MAGAAVSIQKKSLRNVFLFVDFCTEFVFSSYGTRADPGPEYPDVLWDMKLWFMYASKNYYSNYIIVFACINMTNQNILTAIVKYLCGREETLDSTSIRLAA